MLITGIITGGVYTAIDVVKTRIQIDPDMKGKNMLTAGRSIVVNEGPAGLLTVRYYPFFPPVTRT